MKPLFLALALTLPAAAATPATPGEAAVRYVEKIRGGQVDLAPGADTAVSPATGQDKREIIASRIKRLSQELDPGPMEAGPVKQDGDLAAVLVRQTSGFDPGRLKVIAIGLVKKGEAWLAAPVPGSFENTALGYDEARSNRIAALEQWMLREQVVDLGTLREQAGERLRKDIGTKLPKEALHNEKPAALLKRLLAACATRDQAVMLGLVGGLQRELPKDWTDRLGAVSRAFSKDTFDSSWRLLASPGVIRTVTAESGDSTHMSLTLACLDASPESGRGNLPAIRFLSLELQRDSEGLWRFDLPEVFLHGEPSHPEDEDKNTVQQGALNALPIAWQRQFAKAKPATAAAAAEAVTAALRAPDADGLLPLLDLDGEPATALLGARRLALMWRDLHSPRDLVTLLPLGFFEKDDSAVAAYQMFSSRFAGRADIRTLFFVRRDGIWQLLSGLRPDDSQQNAPGSVGEWATTQAPEWTKNWEELALAKGTALDALPAADAPDEDAARTTFTAWNEAITKGDVVTTIRLTARLKQDLSSSHLLRNLGYELTGAAMKTGRQATILGIIHRGQWTGISARIGKAGDAEATYPLYPMVTTPDGPRIMAEIGLFANGNRTRDYLNETSWERLNAGGAGEAAAQLREIYEIHRKNAETDRPPAPKN
ncbi:MAG: hypothetical protein QM755_12645 [Luteolibacter sp.]